MAGIVLLLVLVTMTTGEAPCNNGIQLPYKDMLIELSSVRNVDGNSDNGSLCSDGNIKTVCHTDMSDDNPWVLLTLKMSYMISSVVIENRRGIRRERERISNTQITVIGTRREYACDPIIVQPAPHDTYVSSCYRNIGKQIKLSNSSKFHIDPNPVLNLAEIIVCIFKPGMLISQKS